MTDEKEVIRPEILDYSVDGIRLHRATPDPESEFVLGVGTPAEQSLQWPDGWPTDKQSGPLLLQWWLHTDDQLRRLRTHFAEPNKGRSQNVCLVDGIWLVWCYAATDIKSLYLQLARQDDEIIELRQTITRLGQELSKLHARIINLDGIDDRP